MKYSIDILFTLLNQTLNYVEVKYLYSSFVFLFVYLEIEICSTNILRLPITRDVTYVYAKNFLSLLPIAINVRVNKAGTNHVGV